MSDYFDLTRIEELQTVLGADTEKILGSMLVSMTGAIERLEAAVAAGELDDATQAAHRARNDALMLSAGPLQQALTAFEAASRTADESATRTALARVREVWPPTRDQLAEAGRSS